MRTVRATSMLTSALALIAAAPALAQEAKPANAASQPATNDVQTGSGALATTGQSEDIIVTAQRREQTLIEIPASISVIGGDALERLQAKSFVDYAQQIPGLNVTQTNPGQSRLILRGINTGSVGSTVAVYVDDVPFGQSSSFANGGVLAGDFDTFDVARVEVLRGPQGTLYGSNSLGGVLKYVTNAPSTEKLEVRAQAGVEDVRRGDIGYLGNAVVNLPLGSNLAVRASGFYHRTPGYLGRTGLAGSEIDRSDSYGGRGSLLFKPSDSFSVRLTAVLQNIAVDSPSQFEADPVTLKPVDAVTGRHTGKRQTRYERYPEFHDIDYRLYSGTLDYDFGFATLTSITSYATQKQDQITDISTNAARGTAALVYGAASPTGVGLGFTNNASLKKWTQEARLVSPKSDIFDWVVGGYYTHEKTALGQEYLPFNLTSTAFIPTATTLTGVLATILGPLSFNRFVYADINAKYEEIAGYANGTLHLGERFDLTLGGRYSHNKQSNTQSVVQFGTGTPTNGRSKEGVFTWSVAPRFELTDNAAVYARVAKGYRPGGPNFIPAGAPAGFPAEFDSDTLVSYEAGVKAETADRTFGIDLSGFYVDWKDILILSSAQTPAGPVGVNANGGRARTYGAEGTATLRPTRGFELSANLAYTKAYLRDDTVAGGGANLAGGLRGDNLPFVPRWSANVSADYRWELGATSAFVGGDVHFQDDQNGEFTSSTAPSPGALPGYRFVYGRPIVMDGYSTVNLRAGVDLGAFTIQVYGRNLFDSQGLINAGGFPFTVPTALGGNNVPLIRATSIRPRTIGATVGVRF